MPHDLFPKNRKCKIFHPVTTGSCVTGRQQEERDKILPRYSRRDSYGCECCYYVLRAHSSTANVGYAQE